MTPDSLPPPRAPPADPARLLAELPHGLVHLVDEHIHWANEAAARLLGAPVQEIIGTDAFGWLGDEQRKISLERYQARMRGEQVPDKYEIVVQRRDGHAVRVELEVKTLGPRERLLVLRDLGDAFRDSALLTALTEIAVTLKSARSVEEVLSIAGDGLLTLGLHFAAVRQERDQITLLHVASSPAVTLALNALAGRPLVGMSAPQALLPEPLLAHGKSVYLDDLNPVLASFLAVITGLPFEKVMERVAALKTGKGVLAPLVVHGRRWGFLGLGSDTLDSKAAAALTLFAVQVGSALEVVSTIADLERKNRDLAAVHALAAGSETELEKALPELLRIAAGATASDVAAIYLVDEEQPSELALVGAHGLAGVQVDRGCYAIAQEMAEGALTRAPQPAAMSVAALPPEPRRALLAVGVEQLALVPLQIKGRLAGLLVLGRFPSRPPFGEDVLSTAQLLADQVAIQVENARLYTEAHRRVRHLSVLYAVSRIGAEAREVGPLVDRVLEEFVAALEVDTAAIYLTGGEKLTLAGVSGAAADVTLMREAYGEVSMERSTVCGRAARERRTGMLNLRELPADEGGLARVVGASHVFASPLLVKSQAIGVIWGIRRADRPFASEEVKLIESCSAQVAVAIEGARLLERERRRVHDLSLLNEVGALVTGHLELSEVLGAGARNLARIADASAFLMLVDEEGKRLEMVATSHDDPSVLQIRLSLDEESAASSAVRSRAPVNIDESTGDPRASVALTNRFGHRALMAVPLMAGDEVIGAIVLGETRPGRRFSSEDVDRAVAVANQLAVGIVNARLYEGQRRRVEELRHLLDISRVITGSLDLEEALVAATRSLSSLLQASHAFVWLKDEKTGELRGVTTSSAEHRVHFRKVRLAADSVSLAAEAIRREGPVWVADALGSPLVNQQLNSRYQMKSLLGLPLVLRGEVLGAVTIGDSTRQRAWTDSEVERATLVVRQVAVAVANARLFEDLKESYLELSRTQAELVKRERLAALGELAAVMAHEVRNPLGVIFNSLGSLRRVLRPTGDAAMLLEIVGEEADRLNRIVGDLLDFARPNEPSLRPEALEAVLSGAVEAATSVASTGQVRIQTVLPLPMAPVPLDARMIRQAFINLVLNAVQAMPRGGTLTLRATEEQRGPGRFARIEVTDTGPGVPETLTDRIFQPFFTTKASGTGLGLAVVKRIIDAHHGEISLDLSTPGQGATFVVRLPMDVELPS